MTRPARLTSSLLAREGEAIPAGGFAAATISLSQRLPSTPAPFRGADPAPVRAWSMAGPSRPKAANDQRVALTVRLDPVRHMRLKIFAARRRCTSQEVMIKALDAYLRANGPDCACMRNEGEP